jgi:hypothetical protein
MGRDMSHSSSPLVSGALRVTLHDQEDILVRGLGPRTQRLFSRGMSARLDGGERGPRQADARFEEVALPARLEQALYANNRVRSRGGSLEYEVSNLPAHQSMVALREYLTYIILLPAADTTFLFIANA